MHAHVDLRRKLEGNELMGSVIYSRTILVRVLTYYVTSLNISVVMLEYLL